MKLSTLSSLAIIAAGVTAGCADSTRPAAGRPVTISFTSATTAGASFSRSADPSISRDVTVTTGTDILVIKNVQLVVARMELARAGATCGSSTASGDDDANENECPELQVAPSIVTLPVDHTVATALNVTVPAGKYSALDAKIRPLRSDNEHGRGSSAFLTAHPEFEGVSVLVSGTFNNVNFTYKGAAKAELEREFNPPLVVEAAPLNLTVSVDLDSWFRNRSGAVIDPSTANAGGPNASLVAEHIKRSFHAFRDDHHDGHDDDDHSNHP